MQRHFGSLYKGKHVGTLGDISTFSFFGNKTITTGEGGMVVTNDSIINEKVVHLKGQGLAKDREYLSRYYWLQLQNDKHLCSNWLRTT